MSRRGDEIKAGMMVLVGIGLFVAFLVSIYGLRLRRESDTYWALFTFSGGIKPGTVVRFGGVQRGQVEAVTISETHPTMLEIRVQVDRGTPVRTDSKVRIAQLGMLSDYYIEVTTGSPDAPLATAGSELEGEAPVDLNAVFGQVQALADRLDTTLRIVNEQVLTTDMENLRVRFRAVGEQVSTLLADVNAVVDAENRENIAEALRSIRGTLQDNRPDLRTTVVNVRDASTRLRDTIGDVQGTITEARPDIEALVDDLGDAIAEANQLLANVDAMVIENRPQVAEMVTNMNAASMNARDLTETLAQEPWRLVWQANEGDDVPAGVGR